MTACRSTKTKAGNSLQVTGIKAGTFASSRLWGLESHKQFWHHSGSVVPPLRAGNDCMSLLSHPRLKGPQRASTGQSGCRLYGGNWVYNLNGHQRGTDITVTTVTSWDSGDQVNHQKWTIAESSRKQIWHILKWYSANKQPAESQHSQYHQHNPHSSGFVSAFGAFLHC